MFLFTTMRHLMLAILTVAAFGGVALKAAAASQPEGSWEKVACPFDASKALLPVTCGRLKVPENYDDPKGRSIEVAVMTVSPERRRDADSAVIFLSGGYPYRRCALDLGHQFLADPKRALDTRCAETRTLRLVPS